MKRIIFVCTGNICRSPTAEGIFNNIATERNASITAISRGLEAYHAGEKPDYRAIFVAKKNNIDISNIQAKQISKEDVESCNYIFTATSKHKEKLIKAAPEFASKIHNLLDFVALEDVTSTDIADPYYGTIQDFEEVFETTYKACEKLITMLK